MAFSTFSGVRGRFLILTPMASQTALAIAGAVGAVGSSPIPFAPKGPSLMGASTIIGVVLGMSSEVGIL